MIAGFRSKRLLPRVLIQVLPATVLALLAIAYFATWVVNDTTRDQHHARIERVAAQSSTALALSLQRIVDMAENLAVNDLVINSLVDAGERDRYIPILFQSLRVPGSSQARVTLADYRGRRIASNTPKLTYVDAPWIDDVMEGRRVVALSEDGMTVAVPILYSGLPEGVLVIELDGRGLADLMKLPVQADAYMVKLVGGAEILTSDENFVPISTGEHVHEDRAIWIWEEAELAGFPELRLFVGDRMATVLAPVEQQEIFLVFAILLSVIAVVLGIMTTALKVAKPIGRFMAGVEEVGGSADLSYRMEPFGSEEFHRLTESFNRMLSQLDSTTQTRDYVDSILNSMTEFMLVVSPDGQVLSGNRAMARVLGCGVEELPGRHIATLLSGDWQELIDLSEGEPSPVERSLIADSRPNTPVLVSLSRLQGDDGSGANFILVMNDVTEQKRAQAELDRHFDDLRRSNADLEQFAYVASHDLKAPLRAIDNLAGWIEEDAVEAMSEESREHMTLLRGRIGRLEALLEGLLQYSRTGRDDAEPETLEIAGLVREVIELLNPREGIRVEVSEELPTIVSPKVPLQQIFHNLIGNAIKHNDREDGAVEVTGLDLGSHFEFAVADNGPGIPEDYQERVFQMFQTLKRRDEVEGSGIGLAVVQKLVQANGGNITLDSQADTRGTTFRFTWMKRDLSVEDKDAA